MELQVHEEAQVHWDLLHMVEEEVVTTYVDLEVQEVLDDEHEAVDTIIPVQVLDEHEHHDNDIMDET